MSEWLGRYPLGRQVTLRVRCVNAAGAPVGPDSCPTCSIYSSTAKVRGGLLLPVADPVAAVGLFALPLFLNADFSPGQFRVYYTWTAAGYSGGAVDTFEVIPSGDAGGPLLGLRYYERPQATFVVQQTYAGGFHKGKNPRL